MSTSTSKSVKSRDDGVRGAQTADRALLLLLELVNDGGPLSLRDLGMRTGVNRAAAYRLVQPLLKHGWVTRDSQNNYGLGPGLVAFAARVMRTVTIRDPAKQAMERIAALTSETVSLHVPHLHDRVCVEVVESAQPVRRVVPVGQSLPLYVGPTGKVMLAFLQPDQASVALQPAASEGVDLVRLHAQLDEVRRLGYLSTIDDRIAGVGGLSAPIFGADGVVGAITVSGPSNRFDQDAMKAVAPELVRECQEVSRFLGESPEARSRLKPPEGDADD